MNAVMCVGDKIHLWCDILKTRKDNIYILIDFCFLYEYLPITDAW